MISALAVMLALSSPPGLSIETRTSKVVTLSFSTPIGEILVTLPMKVLSLNDSTLMRAGWPEVDLADVALVDLALHIDLLDVAERHDQRGGGAQHENRADRVAHLHVAREDDAVDGRDDRGIAQLLLKLLEGGAAWAPGRGLLQPWPCRP